MHDYIHIIEQDPSSAFRSLYVKRLVPTSAQFILNTVGDGSDMHINGSGADDEEVGEVGHFADIEHDYAYCLFLDGKERGSPGDSAREQRLAGLSGQMAIVGDRPR